MKKYYSSFVPIFLFLFFMSGIVQASSVASIQVRTEQGVIELSNTSEFGVRLEQMIQQADPSQVIGNQASQDLVPDVEAMILQLNYTLQF